MHDLTGPIDDIKARWMTGGDAQAACPAPWRDALGDSPNLTLLALAGQFTQLATTPSTGTLTGRVPLPKLALPTLAEDLRPSLRRVLDGKSTHTGSVLNLLAARGVTAHPADWMPKASTEAPDIYGPWIDWVSQNDSVTGDDTLTAENWDDWLPNARRTTLDEMRRTAPETARDLIAQKAADLPAEQRLRMIAVLHTGLSEADIDVLESFTNDRSGKVQSMVNTMLARLGKSRADKDAIEEFAAFFDIKKAGIFSRKQVIIARKLKTNAQKTRRWDLANALPFTAFAEAFGVTPSQMIDMFDFGDGSEDLVAIVAATGTADHAQRLLDRIADASVGIDIVPLAERIDGAARRDVAIQMAKKDANAFDATRHTLGDQLGTLDYATLSGSPSTATLKKHLTQDDGRGGPQIEAALSNLGLIASQSAAERFFDDITIKLGLMAADPRLALLRLSASLPDTSLKET
ncbi:MAG: DUF5691 domain-containing protein [Paracoccaceae bacterium]